jgi:hypothetical protein
LQTHYAHFLLTEPTRHSLQFFSQRHIVPSVCVHREHKESRKIIIKLRDLCVLRASVRNIGSKVLNVTS